MNGPVAGIVVGVLLARWARTRPHERARLRGSSARRGDRRSPAGLLSEPVRTSRVARLVFRLLERLYDLGLGRLVGHRFLRLTHRGRRSGRLYRTVLEVITYEPTIRENVVLSGWGERADWYRNIRAAPALEVVTAGQRYAPVQRFLGSSELYIHLQGYVERYPPLRGIVTRTLGLVLDGSEVDRANLEARGYRGVAFRPRSNACLARMPSAHS